MLFNLPAMLGLFAAARPLVRTIYGEQWIPCVPYLQILSLAGILWPLHVINLSVLQAQGRSDLFFRLEVIKKCVGIAIVSVSCFFGLKALAWSTVGMSAVCFLLNAHYTGKFLNYSAKSQIRDVLPLALASGIMLAFIIPLGLMRGASAPLLAAAQVFVGVAVYAVACYLMAIPAFNEITQHIRSGWARFQRRASSASANTSIALDSQKLR